MQNDNMYVVFVFEFEFKMYSNMLLLYPCTLINSMNCMLWFSNRPVFTSLEEP